MIQTVFTFNKNQTKYLALLVSHSTLYNDLLISANYYIVFASNFLYVNAQGNDSMKYIMKVLDCRKSHPFCICKMFLSLIDGTHCSSEIHEKMCCNRCRQHEVMHDCSLESDHINEGYRPDEEDIGGFAGITGCLNSLKSHEKQVCEITIFGLLGVEHGFFPQKLF